MFASGWNWQRGITWWLVSVKENPYIEKLVILVPKPVRKTMRPNTVLDVAIQL